MSKLVSEYGINFFNKGVEALLDYTEKLTREEIRNIPDGVYEFEDWVDNDGSIEKFRTVKNICKNDS